MLRIEIIHEGSRIPLAEVKQHPNGVCFPEPAVAVQPKVPDWEGRLEIGDTTMLD